MNRGFTAVDLFAGIGGFRIAVERCGGHCVAFSEINSDAIDCYIRNHTDSAREHLGDIKEYIARRYNYPNVNRFGGYKDGLYQQNN